MTATFALTFIAISLSIALICLLLFPLRRQEKHYFWQRSGNYVKWTGLGLLFMLILSACGDSTTSTPPPPITPLALTVTAQSSATATAPSGNSTDWTTYHRDNQRTGYIANTPDPQSLSKSWAKQLDGAVYAEPLVVGNRVIVATEGDSLYALDPATGNVQWHTNVGTPVPQSTLPCGNIDPLGITGTPVYDPATGLVYAVAEVSGPAHILVGVDVTNGQVKVRRSVDTDGMDPRAHQQRAALTLANGMIYIPYGGLDGDCSDYIGRVVASRTDGQGALLVYRVPTTREGGIWATPGASVDADGNLFVSVGNGEVTSGQWDHSDSILKLSPTLELLDAFAPTTWASENAGDVDMGSQGPVLLPNNFVFAAGKSGKGYTLRASALGGIGGQVDVQDVCHSYGGAATVGSTIFIPCTEGVRQVSVDANGKMHLGWQASGNIFGSPIVGGHTVYSISSDTLYALNMDSGQVVTSLNVGQMNRFATPTIAGSSLFIGTMTGITAVKIA
ncbi:MAG: PQQ-binding-like beta-propeller repeat protein [Ktedonobacteraceae bacterium]